MRDGDHDHGCLTSSSVTNPCSGGFTSLNRTDRFWCTSRSAASVIAAHCKQTDRQTHEHRRFGIAIFKYCKCNMYTTGNLKLALARVLRGNPATRLPRARSRYNASSTDSYHASNGVQKKLETDKGWLEEAGSCQVGVVIPLHWVVGRPVEP